MRVYLKKIFEYYSMPQTLIYLIVISLGLLTIDYLNYPSIYLRNAFSNENIVFSLIVFGAIIAIFILLWLEFKLNEAFKIPVINRIDYFSVIALGAIVLYFIFATILGLADTIRLALFILVIVFFCVIFRLRSVSYNVSANRANKYSSSNIKLERIINNTIQLDDLTNVLIEEQEADYDLLERSVFIDYFYRTIIDCNPEEKFVIGLDGKWGSGKTTILKMVNKKIKESDNIIWIDEFDPWIYKDEVSLYYNMFDIILKKSGFRYSAISIKRTINSVADIIFGNQKRKSLWNSMSIETDAITKVHNRINDYLKQTDKKIVFVIDNLDRADSKNIVLLFNLVSNVFNFKRVIYIISCDQERVNKIFEEDSKFDSQYFKKVIQMELHVPEISQEVKKKLYKQSIHNILIKFGETEENLDDYEVVLDLINNEAHDIRDLKRFINSVLNFPFGEIRYLNKRDMFALLTIYFFNPLIYSNIHKHRKYYISHGIPADRDLYEKTYLDSSLKDKSQEYFTILFNDEKTQSYKRILFELFPNAKKYSGQKNPNANGFSSDAVDHEIDRKARICNAKYFDLYFSFTSNNYSEIKVVVEKFVEDINKTTDYNGCKNQISEFINNNNYDQDEVFSRILLVEDDFNKAVFYDLALALFDAIPELKDSYSMFRTSARSKANQLVGDILQKMTDIEFKEFLFEVKSKYDYLLVISDISWHLNENNGNEERKTAFKQMYSELGEAIISKEIDIYADQHYKKGNLIGLLRLYSEENNEAFKEYISRVIGERSIFRLLDDILHAGHSTDKSYYIKEEVLTKVMSVEEIDVILGQITRDLKADEQHIHNAYEKFKEGLFAPNIVFDN